MCKFLLMPVWIAAFAFLVLSAPATANDFSITIPVRIENMDQTARNVLIVCVVAERNLAGVDVRLLNEVLGRLGIGQELLIVNQFARRLATDVTVAFHADGARDPSRATHWGCSIAEVRCEVSDAGEIHAYAPDVMTLLSGARRNSSCGLYDDREETHIFLL